MERRGLLKQIPPRYRSTYFGHTMEGGYTAGYYSYIWAEVLDCDAFEAFKETGDIFNPEVASKFRTYVLTPGGIDEGMVMYRNFRGKDPDIKPLLRNRGLGDWNNLQIGNRKRKRNRAVHHPCTARFLFITARETRHATSLHDTVGI